MDVHTRTAAHDDGSRAAGTVCRDCAAAITAAWAKYDPTSGTAGPAGTAGLAPKGPNVQNDKNLREKLMYLRERRDQLAAAPVTQTLEDGTTFPQTGNKQQDKINAVKEALAAKKRQRQKTPQSYSP